MKIIIKICLYLIIIGVASILNGENIRGKLSCSDCGENKMDREFLRQLQRLENKCSFNFKVNSGYRCEIKNRKVGGSRTSAHLKGLAVDISDIALSSNQKERFIGLARESNYFTKVIAYYDSDHFHIEKQYGNSFIYKKTYKNKPLLYVSDLKYFGGFNIDYFKSGDKIIARPGLRLGYLPKGFKYNKSIVYLDIFSDKFVYNAMNDVSHNQIALGIGENEFKDPYYLGYNLSSGLGTLLSNECLNEQKRDLYFLIKPGICLGLFRPWIDLQLNVSYLWTYGVELPSCSNYTIDGINFSIALTFGRFY